MVAVFAVVAANPEWDIDVGNVGGELPFISDIIVAGDGSRIFDTTEGDVELCGIDEGAVEV